MLISVPFVDNRVWQFIESYYNKRVPKEIFEGINYTILKCKSCGMLYQEYILSEENMFLLYESWISAEESLNKKKYADSNLFARYSSEILRIFNFINKKPHEIRVLEYGMGWGYWLRLAQAFGLNVTGVELSKERVAFALERGLEVISDITLESSGSYDYIYSNQVFEHLEFPQTTLSKLSRLISKDGIINISVPVGNAIEKRLKGAGWRARKDALHALEHINCFNYSSLKKMAELSGLKLLPFKKVLSCDSERKGLPGYIKSLNNYYRLNQVFLTKA